MERVSPRRNRTRADVSLMPVPRVTAATHICRGPSAGIDDWDGHGERAVTPERISNRTKAEPDVAPTRRIDNRFRIEQRLLSRSEERRVGKSDNVGRRRVITHIIHLPAEAR